MTVGVTPTVGGHTREILTKVLGYSEEHVRELEEGGVVRASVPPEPVT
jgi:crotonobetainyl-CoA:carnitine CoA-transferase CaiB-like acyl-CoA transferase